jgi:hypothetical protein
MRSRRLWFVLCALMLALSCASSGAKRKKVKKLGPPPSSESASAGPADEHFDEVRKSAAEQLECPEDQIVVQCTERDRDGNCIAVRAIGCEKQFEYQFGTG